MVIAWVALPALVLFVALGLGLLLQRLVVTSIPLPLLVGLGLSLAIVLTTFLTAFPALAHVSGPALLIVVAIGWAMGWSTLTARRPTWWSGVAAIVVYAVYSAPVALSGKLTWAGFIKLDDTGTWLTLADQLASSGRTTNGLAHSTYGVLLDSLFANGYPVGAFADLGIFSRLLNTDPAWLIQPLMSVLAAILALTLYSLTAGLIKSRKLRALTAGVAAQSSLLLGYVLWGGLKEITAALLIACACACLPQLSKSPETGTRWLLLVAVPTAGILAVFGIAGAVWLVPLLIAQLVISWYSFGVARTFTVAGEFVAIFLLLSIPTLLLVPKSIATAQAAGALLGGSDQGNLLGPLRFEQIFGIWPIGDFRVPPTHIWYVRGLILVAALAALAGLAVAAQRRSPALLLFALGGLGVSVLTAFENSWWLEGKSLAMASPALLLAAGVGVAYLLERGRRFEALGIGVLLAGGVLASNLMQYGNVWLAPSGQMQELATIGESPLPTPALMVDYSPIGARHFLRKLDVEGAQELRYNPIPTYAGVGLTKGAYADVDFFPVTTLAPYQTLILRNAVYASRPPSLFSLKTSGHFYQVWVQNPYAPRIISHWPLGTTSNPTAPAPCDLIKQAAAVAGPTGQVAVAKRSPIISIQLDTPVGGTPWSPGWAPGGTLVTRPGQMSATFAINQAGSYFGSLGGSFWGDLTLTIDGQPWYRDRGQINWAGYATPLPAISLAPGIHVLTVSYSTGLAPGTHYLPSGIGPIFLSQSTSDVPVTYVPSAKAPTLCGQIVDWIEAVGP